jgi:hypothetical protein
MEDLSGFRTTADDDAALLAARNALLAAGKAVLVACGDYDPGQKWVWRQLGRSAPPAFPIALFQGLMRGDLLDERGQYSIADLESFTQTCLTATATAGWHGAIAAWPRWQTGPGPLTRAPGFFPRVHEDAVIAALTGLRRVRLNPEVALVWALCNGVSEDEMIADVQELRNRVPAYRGLAEDRCREIVALLTGSRLVLSR